MVLQEVGPLLSFLAPALLAGNLPLPPWFLESFKTNGTLDCPGLLIFLVMRQQPEVSEWHFFLVNSTHGPQLTSYSGSGTCVLKVGVSGGR